jgi:hypothetical protein
MPAPACLASLGVPRTTPNLAGRRSLTLLASASLLAACSFQAQVDVGSPTATTTSPAAPECSDAQVRLTAGQPDVGAGNVYQPFTVTNISATTCQLAGYANAEGLSAAGEHLATAEHSGPAQPPARVLTPGSSLQFVVHASDVPHGDAETCPSDIATLVVALPHSQRSTTLSLTLPDCGGLSVTAMGGTA